MSRVFQRGLRSVLAARWSGIRPTESRNQLRLVSSAQNSKCSKSYKSSQSAKAYGLSRLASTAVELEKSFSIQGSELQLDVSHDRRLLTIRDGYGFEESYNSTWLRHQCHCPECYNKVGKQQQIEIYTLPAFCTIKHVTVKDDCLFVEWNETDHVGELPLDFLADSAYSFEACAKKIREKIPSVRKGEIQRISYQDVITSEEALWRWVKSINEDGICIMEGVPKEMSLPKVVNILGDTQSSPYNEVFVVENKENVLEVAYSDVPLPSHMDLSYYEGFHGVAFMRVPRFDDCIVGGETIITDAWYEAERMRILHPEEFQTLTRVPRTFQRIDYDRERKLHIRCHRPHFAVDQLGEITSVCWAPVHHGPLCVPEEDVEPYCKAVTTYASMLKDSDSKIQFRLKEGDVMNLNNRRMLHGRTKMERNGGVRIFEGTYLCIEDFLCHAEYLSRKYEGKPAKRMFNQNIF